MHRKHFGLRLALLSSLAASPALAAVQIHAVVKDLGAAPRVYRVPLFLEDGMLNINATPFTGAASPSEIIYRADRRKIWQIDHADRSYLELDERLLVNMSAGVDTALKAIEDWWNDDESKPAAAPAWRAAKTGEKKNLSGLHCERYEVRNGSQLVQEIWLASWTQAGLRADVFRVVRELAASYEKIWSAVGSAPVLNAVPLIPMTPWLGLDGYPVIFRHYQGGRLRYEILLGVPAPSASTRPRFDVPAEYRKRLF